MLPAARVPTASVTTLASALPAPTAALKLVAPLVFTVKPWPPNVAPSTVEANAMAPPPLLVSAAVLPNATAAW